MDKLGKIVENHWEKRLKISKIVKIESVLLKTNEDNSSSKSRNEIIWWGYELVPTIKSPVNFRNSAKVYLRSFFRLNISLSNLAVLLILRPFFQ